ncbi:hypothetical protein [Faecalibaculum rodentium]|nr:hypothetical protein [Faecalibaculum rodentium]
MKREYHQMKAERDASIEKIYGFKSENDGLKTKMTDVDPGSIC